jgi:hypothetical protein
VFGWLFEANQDRVMFTVKGCEDKRIRARLLRAECCASWLALTELLKYFKISQNIKQ